MWHADLMTADGDTSDTLAADSSTITGDDITRLNGRSVERAGAFTRLAGTALIVAGGVGVLAWLWLTVRQQQALNDTGSGDGFEFGSSEVSFANRIDALAGYVSLLLSAVLALGVGLGLRLVAEYSVARTGGSLTGFATGDPVPDGGIAGPPSGAD
jgi:hypothetical protein